jgi:membrane protease YdiL (CAAX protease family)
VAAIAAPGIESPSAKLIAPSWHTALLVALFLGLALSGAVFQQRSGWKPGLLQQHPHVLPLYFSLIVMEWGLFYLVWKGGLGRSGTKLSELVGGRWANTKEVFVDVGLALGLWAVWIAIERAIDRWFGPGHAASIQTLLPQRMLETLLWIGVSISAGICEELVFRGYFQRQFHAYTHSRWIALFLQAVLFGVSHGYQGAAACAKITILGALYGSLALWRKSLRPGMMAHAWSDILSGTFRI